MCAERCPTVGVVALQCVDREVHHVPSQSNCTGLRSLVYGLMMPKHWLEALQHRFCVCWAWIYLPGANKGVLLLRPVFGSLGPSGHVLLYGVGGACVAHSLIPSTHRDFQY